MILASAPPRGPRFDEPALDADLLTARAGAVRFLVVPERRYLMVDGRGAPGSDSFRLAIGAIYPVAYTLHFGLRQRGVTAKVGVLEGLYWLGTAERPIGANGFDLRASPNWRWRLLVPVAAEADADDVRAAIDEVARKKHPAGLARLRVESWREGRVAQTLHVGPYADEGGTIAELHRAIEAAGLHARGCHHEIYLGDPNRSAPERLKTIIRQPVEVKPIAR